MDIQDIYPLTPLQQGLLFHTLASDRAVYVDCHCLHIEGEIDLGLFQRSWQHVLGSHAALRSAFVWQRMEEPLQVVRSEAPSLPLVNEDWRNRSDDERRRLLADCLERLKCERMDVQRAPLMRLVLARFADREYKLLWACHHLILDGWSASLVIKQVMESYEALHRGEAAPRYPTRSFGEYVSWLRSHDVQAAEEAWREYFRDITEPAELALSRPPSQTPHGTADLEYERVISSASTERLGAFATSQKVTLNTLLQGAWALVLRRYTQRRDVTLGLTINGRGDTFHGIDQMVGVFINTLPVRVQVDDAKSLGAWLRDLHRRHIQLRRFDSVSLVQIQQWSGLPANQRLFESFLVIDNPQPAATPAGARNALCIRQVEHHRAATDYPLVLGAGIVLAASEEQLAVRIAAQPGRFDEGVPERMLVQWVEVLRRMSEMGAEARLGDLSGVTDAQRRHLTIACNQTATPPRVRKCMHEMFIEQAARTPEAIALVHGATRLTYAELDRRSSRLAHFLRSAGVGPEVLVAICMARSPQMVTGLLGVLKAGGAYLSIDPGYPAERIGFMLEDAHAHVLLASGSSAEVAGARVARFDLDQLENTLVNLPSTPPSSAATPGNLAYCIYTSGSTGRPKGVLISHASVMNYIDFALERYQIAAGRGAPVNTSLAFDATITSLLLPLMCGREVVLLPEGLEEIPALGATLAAEPNYSVVKLTPAQLTALRHDCPAAACRGAVRAFIIGGEALDHAHIEFWRRHAPHTRLINEYGPTETVVGCVVHEVHQDSESPPSGPVPIGKPIANTQGYVLDEDLEIVPEGVTGELYIGGAGVGRGYLGRPGLTAYRFLADPFAEAGARMYRTGDRVRYLADGNLEYLGRADDQVKIRGVRIELGEVEAQLRACTGVRDAAIAARELPSLEKQLVGYVTMLDGTAMDAERLREQLRQRLPEYMLPAAFVELSALPLNASGKVDRKALQSAAPIANASQRYEPPVGPIEPLLAEIWQALLRVELIGRHDNFFELGGHSLLVIQMAERLRAKGLDVELGAVFEYPTLAALADTLRPCARADIEIPPNALPEGCARITPEMLPLAALDQSQIDSIVAGVPGEARNVQDIYPLVPLQEGILFHRMMNPQGDIYIVPMLLELQTRAHLTRFTAALQRVIDRHDMLRAGVFWEYLPRPVNVVLRRAELLVSEVLLEPNRSGLEQMKERMRVERLRMDVMRPPLVTLQVAQDPRRPTCYALLAFHHLAIDQASMEIIVEELAAYFNERAGGLAAPVGYREHVVRVLASKDHRDAEAYFRRTLGGVTEATTPFGLVDIRDDGARIEEAREEVIPELARRVRACARQFGVSCATLFHAAWSVVLARVSERTDVVFGTVMSGRSKGSTAARRIVGVFINTLPVRVDLQALGTADLLARLHRDLAELLNFEHVPLALAQRCSGVAPPGALFSSLLNYRHTAPPESRAQQDARPIRLLAARNFTNYPIVLAVDDLETGFALTAQTDRSIDPRRLAACMRESLEALTGALERAPDTPALGLSVVAPLERRELLETFNATQADYAHRCVHELFAEQARRSPQGLAVVHGEQRLTYRELEERSNQLAHRLRKLGVGAEDRVALCVDRGVQMLVGLLGVLKAGGAYVPLDPSYPRERLAYMLQDSAPVVLLTQSQLQGELEGLSIPQVLLDSPDWWSEPTDALERVGQGPHQLAYMIYTSGSTGRPKGVMVEHGGVVNVLSAVGSQLGVGAEDGLLALTTVSFDIAALELFMPLLHGARVIVADRAQLTDAHGLMSLIERSEATLIQATPATWQVLLSEGWAGSGRLKVLCGGEALGRELGQRLRARVGELWNMYGPTETTIWSCDECIEGSAGEWKIELIGRPLWNTQVYVLDERLEAVPLGAVGELYIGGAGLARGYWGRAGLTAERFVANPYGAGGSRLYRTGDRVRYREGGKLEFLGRADQQLKLRGYRIEPGEIEAQLCAHPQIRQAAVVAREDAAGERRLVAYVVSEGGVEDAGQWRAHLKRSLPDYMIPSAFVSLPQLPLTPNGKLDRSRLPAPQRVGQAVEGEEAARTPTEQLLAQIWGQVLGVAQVGVSQDFFELGGDSLLAMRVMARLRERLGIDTSVRVLFEGAATVRGLAAHIEGLHDQPAEPLPQLVARPRPGAVDPTAGIKSSARSGASSSAPQLDADRAQVTG